jgi:hypothetical protein
MRRAAHPVIARQERRAEREREFAARAKAAGRYGVIVSAMPLDQARVPEIAFKDCVLFLHVRPPELPDALAAVKACGFSYRSNLVYRVRRGRLNPVLPILEQHVLLLVCVRGKVPAPAMGTQYSSVIERAEVPAMIRHYFPNVPTHCLAALRS